MAAAGQPGSRYCAGREARDRGIPAPQPGPPLHLLPIGRGWMTMVDGTVAVHPTRPTLSCAPLPSGRPEMGVARGRAERGVPRPDWGAPKAGPRGDRSSGPSVWATAVDTASRNEGPDRPPARVGVRPERRGGGRQAGGWVRRWGGRIPHHCVPSAGAHGPGPGRRAGESEGAAAGGRVATADAAAGPRTPTGEWPHPSSKNLLVPPPREVVT